MISTRNKEQWTRVVAWSKLPKYLDVFPPDPDAVPIKYDDAEKTCNTCNVYGRMKNWQSGRRLVFLEICITCIRCHNRKSTKERDCWTPVIEGSGVRCSVCETESEGLKFSDTAGIICEKCFMTAKRCACGCGDPVIRASGGIKCRECWVTDGDWLGAVEALRAEDMITRQSVAGWE